MAYKKTTESENKHLAKEKDLLEELTDLKE